MLLESLETSLREDFGASEWLLLLAPTQQSTLHDIVSRHLRMLEANASEWKMFDTLFEAAKPRCGQIRDSQRDFLFGAAAPWRSAQRRWCRSVAASPPDLLAIGSPGRRAVSPGDEHGISGTHRRAGQRGGERGVSRASAAGGGLWANWVWPERKREPSSDLRV